MTHRNDSHHTPRYPKHLAAGCTLLLLLACSGGGDSPEPAAPPASIPAPGNLTVSTSVSGAGSMSPSTSFVASGGTATFTASAANGYQLVGVSGCGGSLSGSTYTTGAVTAACTVTATFSAATAPSANYTVSTRVTGSGTISAASASIASGNTTSFTLAPSSGYQIASVTGCGGTLSARTYTTGPITAACRVTAIFNSTATLTGFGPQSSSKAQEWGFDFVEEFDGLEDWNQSHLGRIGAQFDSSSPNLTPRLANGSASAWGYFSAWSSSGSTPHKWIGGIEGDRRVWRGTKSAAIDLGGAKGPSRLGLFLGNGYTNWSYFYMVWMPKNSFPTFIACPAVNGVVPETCATRKGGVGTYTEGDPYTYWAAYKFNTFSMGCFSSLCPTNEAYGLHSSLLMLKARSYDPKGLSFLQFASYDHIETYAVDGGSVMDSKMGQWFGIEMNINNVSATQSIMNVWIYDQTGNSVQIMIDKPNVIDPEARNSKWDHFFFGGNNSESWQWGDSMSSHYYVDDLIIDHGSKGRIGPRYFNAIR